MAVVSSTALTMPSLERAAINRSTIIVTTKSRNRHDGASLAMLRIRQSSAILRNEPSAAARCLYGNVGSIRGKARLVSMTMPPLSRAFSLSTTAPGKLDQVGERALLRMALIVAETLAQQHGGGELPGSGTPRQHARRKSQIVELRIP